MQRLCMGRLLQCSPPPVCGCVLGCTRTVACITSRVPPPFAVVCRNCPECKRLPDVMQLCTGAADSAAAFELCQRQYGCAICACK